jgi:5-methylcytosine-specific restriction endonuclease McrA
MDKREYCRAYYQKNKEKMQKQYRDWYWKHKKEQMERRKNWYQEHKGYSLRKSKEYYQKNLEKIHQRQKEYWHKRGKFLRRFRYQTDENYRKRISEIQRRYYSTPEGKLKKKQLARKWYLAHKDKVREYRRKYITKVREMNRLKLLNLASHNGKIVCQKCGNTDLRVLLVHHIDKNRNNNNPENLQILCYNCHILVHRKISFRLSE